MQARRSIDTRASVSGEGGVRYGRRSMGDREQLMRSYDEEEGTGGVFGLHDLTEDSDEDMRLSARISNSGPLSSHRVISNGSAGKVNGFPRKSFTDPLERRIS